MQRVRIIVIGVLMTLAISGVSVRAQKSNRLAVGYGSISTNYLPLWMAREAGIFRKKWSRRGYGLFYLVAHGVHGFAGG